jgi:hypothetical protein
MKHNTFKEAMPFKIKMLMMKTPQNNRSYETLSFGNVILSKMRERMINKVETN